MATTKPKHTCEIIITFGDCDPAGIVFYPNFYRFIDRTFHDWLRQWGSHNALASRVNGLALGLIESGAQFHHVVLDGDVLRVDLRICDWRPKTFRVEYVAYVSDTLCLTAFEVRGLFQHIDNKIRAIQVLPLKTIIDP
ncbi:MAG: acyl-CoA thioesterase [Proteobacteria bacterium]|nr:acyl-CoA thioesterase [Pseudomonadota bacterium]MDA1331436.1 acyl-CoA thioesterase [Pseudomonadota bacterium]